MGTSRDVDVTRSVVHDEARGEAGVVRYFLRKIEDAWPGDATLRMCVSVNRGHAEFQVHPYPAVGRVAPHPVLQLLRHSEPDG